MDEISYRRAMARFATSVAVTTAVGPAGPVGCTTTALLSLSLRPPTLLVSLDSSGRTLRDLRRAGVFAVNVLSGEQRDLVGRFATGDPCRRFGSIPHEIWSGAPVLTEASVAVVCELRETVRALDHTLLIGAVTGTRTRAPAVPPLVLLDGRPHRPEPVATDLLGSRS